MRIRFQLVRSTMEQLALCASAVHATRTITPPNGKAITFQVWDVSLDGTKTDPPLVIAMARL